MRYLAVALVAAAAGVGANSLVEGPKPTIGDVGEWCGPDGYLPKRQMAGVIKPGAGGNRRTLCHKTKRWISPMGQGGICWSQKKPSRFSGLPLFRAKPSFRRPFKVRLLEYDSVGIATTLVEEEKAKLLRVKGEPSVIAVEIAPKVPWYRKLI